MVDDWAPPLPEGWSVDDVFCGEPVDDVATRALMSGPEAELVADIWASDARAAKDTAALYVAVDALARQRPAVLDRPAGAPGSAGPDTRASRAPRLESVSEAFVPELALIRGCTEQEAETLALAAVAVVRHLPGTLAAMQAGRCSPRKAEALVDLLSPVSAEVAARVEAAVLTDVDTRTGAQLRAKVRRLLAKWDAEALEQRRAEARRRADVRHRPVGDGMSQLVIDLPTPVAAACKDACDQHARLLRAGGDARPIGELRAGVAADLVLRPWDTSRPPVTANITVHVPLSSLGGGASGDGAGPGPAEPAEVGGEWVTAAQCAELLAQLDVIGLRAPAGGSLQVAVEDETGRVIAVANRRELERGAQGRRTRRRPRTGDRPATSTDRDRGTSASSPNTAETRTGDAGTGGAGRAPTGRGLRPPRGARSYRPTAEQRRFVQVRDRTCRMPGCRRRAGRCDVDHGTPWHAGGETEVCNLACLCRRHHRIKTHTPGWQFTLLPDGRLRVRTPSGVVRTSAPPGWCTDPEPDPPWWEEMAPPDPAGQS